MTYNKQKSCQVQPFRCKLQSFQEDADNEVVVEDDTMVADDEFGLELWHHLE